MKTNVTISNMKSLLNSGETSESKNKNTLIS